MTKIELIHLYIDWMYQLVVDNRYSNQSYHKLFAQLYEMEFTYTIPMDGNRAEDGIDLRYRFGREYHFEDAMVTAYLNDRPCSVLEMIVALAIRCEEHIMDDPDIGNRTGQWFWSMLVSLGLGAMNDIRFDPDYVDDVIERLLDHDYQANGEGGLFTVEYARYDMRSIEIWYQMNCYLNEIMSEGSI